LRTFRGDISTLTGGGYVPFNTRDFAVGTSTYTDDALDGGTSGTAEVPSVSVGGKYKLILDYRPQRTTLTVTLNGIPASLVEYPAAPVSVGSVGINYLSGVLEFNVADIGKAVVATYKDLGSVLDAGSLNQIQKDLEFAQETAANHTHLADQVEWVGGGSISVEEGLNELTIEIGGKQNADSDLTAIAGLSTTGLIARTNTGAAAVRTITGSTDLSVTNGNGVSGNPTISLGSNVAKKNVDNGFSVLQQLLAGALIAGLNLPGEQIYATAGNLVHNVVLTDVIFSCWTTGANTINLNLPDLATVPFGHILLIFNVSSMTTGVVLNTFNGSQHINGAGISPVTSLTLGTGDTQLYLLIADPVIRWRIFQLV